MICIVCDFSKDDMFPIEMRSCSGTQEELRPVGVGSCVCHRQNSRASVLVDEILVFKFVPVDGLAAGAIASREVSPLTHEAGNDTMKRASFITITILSAAKFLEIAHRFWDIVFVEVHDNTTFRFASDTDVEEDLRIGHGDGVGSIDDYLNISDYM